MKKKKLYQIKIHHVDLHMFIGTWEMETPRNVSSNAHTATGVVDMAEENGVGTGWTNAFRGNR